MFHLATLYTLVYHNWLQQNRLLAIRLRLFSSLTCNIWVIIHTRLSLYVRLISSKMISWLGLLILSPRFLIFIWYKMSEVTKIKKRQRSFVLSETIKRFALQGKEYSSHQLKTVKLLSVGGKILIILETNLTFERKNHRPQKWPFTDLLTYKNIDFTISYGLSFLGSLFNKNFPLEFFFRTTLFCKIVGAWFEYLFLKRGNASRPGPLYNQIMERGGWMEPVAYWISNKTMNHDS